MWIKVDDRMHAHRKTRTVVRSHDVKSRDIAPLGLWLVAASWAGQNQTDGWVPIDELDRWDDDWKSLVARLVESGYWWVEDRDGEPGYRFHDWHDYNDPADSASKAGTYGNHVRWHVNEAKVDPECEHCPKEPDEPEYRPDSGGDIGGRSGGDSHPDSGGESRTPSGAIALPEPEPDPNPIPKTPSSDDSGDGHRFDEFWDTYDHKVGRKKCETAYKNALKKSGVTPDLLIAAAGAYIDWQRLEGKHPQYTKNPLTWLHGEHWQDERPGRSGTSTALRLSVAEDFERPPSGLDDQQYAAWDEDRRQRADEARRKLGGAS